PLPGCCSFSLTLRHRHFAKSKPRLPPVLAGVDGMDSPDDLMDFRVFALESFAAQTEPGNLGLRAPLTLRDVDRLVGIVIALDVLTEETQPSVVFLDRRF